MSDATEIEEVHSSLEDQLQIMVELRDDIEDEWQEAKIEVRRLVLEIKAKKLIELMQPQKKEPIKPRSYVPDVVTETVSPVFSWPDLSQTMPTR